MRKQMEEGSDCCNGTADECRAHQTSSALTTVVLRNAAESGVERTVVWKQDSVQVVEIGQRRHFHGERSVNTAERLGVAVAGFVEDFAPG